MLIEWNIPIQTFFLRNRELIYFQTGEFINILIFMIQNFPQLPQ